MSIDSDSIKKIAIKSEGSGYDTKDIGAEPENINIYRKSDGTSVPSTSSDIATTKTLDETLNDLGGGAYVGTESAFLNLSADKRAKYDYQKGALVTFTDDNDSEMSLIGTSDISNNKDGTLTGIVGNTSISSIGDGTLTGAVNNLKSSLNTINSDSITFSPSINVTNGGINRIGRLAIAEFEISNTLAFDAGFNGSIGTLPSGHRALSNGIQYGVAWVAQSSTSVSIYVGGGNIYLQTLTSIPANYTIRGSIAYFCN